LLATAPEAERRMLAEIDTAAASPGEEDSGQLLYTRQVLQETMRLYPPVWVYPRIALQDDRFGDFPVPRRTHVLIVSYLIHLHPAFWPETARFIPDRFADLDRTSPAFMPFGLGPRRCAGEDYSFCIALTIIRSIAAQLILRPSGDPFPGLAAGINLRP